MTESELLFGQAGPLPEQVELRAGPISLIFEDGSIRYLRWGSREILRRVYAAVRDHEWRTILGKIQDVEIERKEQSFRITFRSEHNGLGIDYIWDGRIEGAADGTITFDFEGESKSLFRRNRIGFCVLHPPEAVIGAKCKATHTDGSKSAPTFPKIIAQEQPVNGLTNLAALSYEIAPGAWVTTEFSGDIFETEDQRNWTDDSFKTYCTPQAFPKPAIVQVGDRVKQRVVVRVEGALPDTRVEELNAPVRIDIDPKKLSLPKIGFGATGASLAFSAMVRLQQLRPSHVRVEAPMNAPDWQQPFADGFREATALKTKVELALRLSGCPGEDLRDLITTYPEPFQHWAFTSSFARILLSTFGEPSTSKRTLEAFRGFLMKTGLSTLDVAVGAGTEGDLADFNHQRPPRDADLFFWSMTPQVHAFDIATISESPNGAAAQVRSVQEYFGDAPKSVSPITLQRRGRVSETGEDATIDPRQRSLFGAVWTLGMLGALTASGATSATFFQTTGPKGVMENGGPVFPVYHVFRAIAGASTGYACKVSHPLAVAALAVRTEHSSRLIIGNYTRTPIDAIVPIPKGNLASIRRLDKDTAPVCLEEPDALWAAATDLQEATVRLAPFEIVFIDQPILPDAV